MTKHLTSIYKGEDSFTRLAKSKGYRSRSSIKLLEIHKKDKIFKRGMNIADLGSYPGGWSQVSIRLVGQKGTVISLDPKKMQHIEGACFINKKLENFSVKDLPCFLAKNTLPFDIVLSDIAPKLSGIIDRDDSLMIGLLDKVITFCDSHLKKGGTALVKVFQGESMEFARNYMKSNFERVRIRKPRASRANSKESYLLGSGYKKR